MAYEGPPERVTTSSSRRQSRRSQRIRTACLRCQQRKIRCDGVLPSCTSCSKSSKTCEYQDGHTINNQSRTRYIGHLEDRVRWLESVVRERCPDVDLTQVFQFGEQVTTTSPSNAAPGDLSETQTEPQEGTNISDLFPSSEMPPPQPSSARPETSEPSNEADSSMTHQIGLVSLPNGDDPRYIGPSSGYFFTKLVCTASALTKLPSPLRPNNQRMSSHRDGSLTEKLLRNMQTKLPENKELTIELTETYFKSVHQHMPFLHEPTHMELIEELYRSGEPDPIVAFQIHMVLAISSVTLSRRDRVVLPSEGWCATAMSYFEKIPLESSTRGLQCLLLLYVWAMHSPSTKLNVWFLNYQCIAMVVDLGLQRDVTSALSISLLDQEMRTRLFWVVYSLDRSLCTMMGRPIGLRDEACDLRLPADIDDQGLTHTGVQPRADGDPPSHMSYAIHMFKLARLNSEMKYILHSISRDTPAYAYPAIRCMKAWQRDMADRLDRWNAEIPLKDSSRDYVVKVCEIRYHVLKTLLLRPSPGIPHPSPEDLKECYRSAISAVRLYHELYVESSLVFSWASYHSLMMSSVTAFYCIWTSPDIAQEVAIDSLISDLRAASNILSATGEHWSGAKRSRDILDELAHRTIRWMMSRKTRSNYGVSRNSSGQDDQNSLGPHMIHNAANITTLDLAPGSGDARQTDDLDLLMHQHSRTWLPGLESIPSGFDQMTDPGTGLWTGDMNTDAFLQDLFDGFAPMMHDAQSFIHRDVQDDIIRQTDGF